MGSPPGEFELQLDVAFLVDFLKSYIKRPLFDVRPDDDTASTYEPAKESYVVL